MFCTIVGLVLALYGSKLSTILVEAFVGYATFLVSMAYLYEETKLATGSVLLISLIFGALSSLCAHKWINKTFIASLGLIIGITLSIFVIALCDLNNDYIVYPLIIFGAICGAASFFKADEFFVYCTSLVGSLISV
jgi:Domain of unknown function (DUF4203)